MALPILVVPISLVMLPRGPMEARRASCGRCDEELRPRHRAYRGDTIRIPFQIVDRDTAAAINIAGWTFWFTAKFALANPDKQAGISQDNISPTPPGNGGIVLVNASLGQGVVTVQPVVTRCFADGPTEMDYDIQVEDTGGIITTVERGCIVVVPDVTRSITNTQP